MEFLRNIHRLPGFLFRYFWSVTPADVRFLIRYFPLVLFVLTLPFAWWVWYQSYHLDHVFLCYLECQDPRPWYQTYEFWQAWNQAQPYWWMVVFVLVWYIVIRDRDV